MSSKRLKYPREEPTLPHCSDVEEDVSVATVARSFTRSGRGFTGAELIHRWWPGNRLTRGASRHAGDAAPRSEPAVPCGDAEYVESQGARGQSVSTEEGKGRQVELAGATPPSGSQSHRKASCVLPGSISSSHRWHGGTGP